VKRAYGFTLIEIILAVAILVLLLLLAVPSITGVFKDRQLRRSLDSFNTLVNKAHEQSVAERRPYLLVVGKNSIEVRPEVITKDDEPAPVAAHQLSDRDSLKMTFPAALIKDPPPEWIFWPSGVCEPVVIDYAGPNGSWTVTYSALNARPEIKRYAAK